MVSIFLFHRDLRLVDHNALERIHDKHIIPLFIFTPEQIGNKNQFKSNNAMQFMIESLQDLNEQLQMHGSQLVTLFADDELTMLEKLLTSDPTIKGVSFNMDYSRYNANNSTDGF